MLPLIYGLWAGLFAITSVSASQADCVDVNQIASQRIVQSILVVQEVREQPSIAPGNHDFRQERTTFRLTDQQRVIIASTADGNGAISSDDLVKISAYPLGKVWEHRFADSSWTKIVPIPPQDITGLFRVDENELEISVRDLMGPVLSTRPYFLVIVESCLPPTATPVPTATFTPSPSSTPTPSFTPVNTSTSTSTATSVPSHTPTSSATSSPTATQTETVLPSPTQTNVPISTLMPKTEDVQPAASVPFNLVVLLGGGTLLGALVVMKRRKPGLLGELTVYYDSKFVETYVLNELKGELLLNRQGVRIDLGQTTEDVAIRIFPRRTSQNVENVMEQIAAGEIHNTFVLQHDDDFRIGDMLLHYENLYQMNEEVEDGSENYEI